MSFQKQKSNKRIRKMQKYLELNTLKYDKLGLRPIHSSYGIFLISERRLTQLTT
jgi:hypothetical protein